MAFGEHYIFIIRDKDFPHVKKEMIHDIYPSTSVISLAHETN